VQNEDAVPHADRRTPSPLDAPITPEDRVSTTRQGITDQRAPGRILADAPPDTTGRAGRRVLVVDDHADAAETLAMLLRHAGHEVVALTHGRAAVDLAADFRPHVVILDIGLPDMSGFDVARALRGLPGLREVEIVAVSGYGHRDHVHRAREAGFSAYCLKPLAGEALRALLDGKRPPSL
jgi:two-component system CheB/CheR fusion protein